MGKASRLLAHEVPGICYDSSKCHSLTSHQLTIQMNPEGSLYFLGCPEAEGSPVLSLHVSPLPGQSQACKQEIFRNQAEVPQNYSAVRCREKEKLRHPAVFLVQKQPFSFRFRWCSLFLLSALREPGKSQRLNSCPAYSSSAAVLHCHWRALLFSRLTARHVPVLLLTKVGEGWDIKVAQLCSTWFRNKYTPAERLTSQWLPTVGDRNSAKRLGGEKEERER